MSKIIKISIGTILLILAIIIFQIITFRDIKNILYDYNTKGKNQIVNDSIKDYDAVMCDFNILNPKYTLLSSAYYQDSNIDTLSIGFFNVSRPHFFSLDWAIEYTGGTTIKNITFPELVKMVKEDCSQFQESYYDLTGYEDYKNLSYDEQTKLWPEIEKNNLNWIYTPAPTPEEIEEENKMSAESFISRLSNEIESQEAWELFVEIYGDPYKMTTEEILKLKEKINKEGQDERIYILDRVTTIHNSWPKLSEKNQQTILAAYGPWEELSDKELADYVERIYTDQEKGKLVLD